MPVTTHFRVRHFQRVERIENDLRNDQPGVLLVIGGDDIPGRFASACRTEALLKSRHIALPELSLLNIGKAEFPIFVRLIDALKKAFSLLVFRQVEIEFDNPGAVEVQVSFQTHNGPKSALPDDLLFERSTCNSLSAENLGVHADD